MNKKYPGRENIDGYIDFRAWKKGMIFRQLYRLGYTPEDFVEKFQTGPLYSEWDMDERTEYVDWSDRAAAQGFVRDLLERGISLKKRAPGDISVAEDALEWIGTVYEMWACYTGLSSKEVCEALGFSDMLNLWDYFGGNEPYSAAKAISASPPEFSEDVFDR